ncbi:Zn-dependent alcohol dehydrogenase [Mycolicibacterium phlei]|uniref:alcohol dehydrogenase n=1 Tax=Mycolicibacterium phlei DSM 43239 = CCUG 21000 TaxID=1226750 RepID=A0A5N5V2N9_MYCPH|nr:zinc-binding dehydrogenase [Mycolicibacterium phlei]VEG11935.1 Zn-dependent alcohol dehydrogenase [Mycobacteroides chelonae]AMO63844.1 Alcohol dehydrogenase [Mycolicibacterium phlei]KAB7754760.1 alcohol dehydrogenase [Mycolicibacterium phlei DSM 43239 = CCUG 21000]KXW65405.1 alcohol dehydrogenase [Mycolicibacterium phlei DSM 43239 = CCUG 21000]KXW69477.1 hypothetical protein MPHL43070_18640 [Mycolicibacterium phlei DSM 43070]
MKAWQFTGIREPLKLIEIEDPVPGPGEVGIDVHAVGLCHSDVGVLEGVTTASLGKIPIILGHEIAGVVNAVGEGVTDFAVGDRVCVRAGADSPGAATDGGYAEKTVSKADFVVKLPDSIPFTVGAAATDAGMTSHHAVIGTGGVKAGDRVGIVGAGGLGMIGLQIAQAAGAKVYVAEPRESARQVAQKYGVEKCVADVSELAGEELDVVVDFAGFSTTTAGALNAVKAGGTVVLAGLGAPETTFPTLTLVVRTIRLLGTLGGEREDVKRVLEYVDQGKVEFTLTEISFDEIPDGLQKLEEGKVDGRLVAKIRD